MFCGLTGKLMDKQALINIETSGDITVVSFNTPSICGVAGVEKISTELRQFVISTKPKKLIIDFCGVKFFSSQMLGLLVDIWRKLTDAGGQLIISGIDPQLGRVFKITNLDKIFKFYPDRDQAINAM